MAEARFAAADPDRTLFVAIRDAADEVITAFGRLGSWFGHQRMGFEQVGSQTLDGGAKEVAMLIKRLR